MSLETALIGLVVGFLVGLTGVGGAALLTPILVMFGVNPSIAIGTDLLYNSITKFFGVIQHARQRTVNTRLVKYLAFGSIPGAVTSVIALNVFVAFYGNPEVMLKHVLGFVLIAVALATIIQQIRNKNEHSYNHWQRKTIEEKRSITIVVGFVFGFIVGMTSVGSGSLFALAILYLFRMSAAELVGTDIAHAFLLVTVAGLLHAKMGNVDYMLTANLLLGSIPGVLVGSSLSTKISGKYLRLVIAVIIFVSGIKLI